MSNALALAAVTATLRSLLIQGLDSVTVTARSLDKAREGLAGDQVNLFLSHTSIVGELRNADLPGRAKPGETSPPALPLALTYLVTAFRDDQDDVRAHALLGRALTVLHDTPVLDRALIRDATAVEVPGSDLHEQVDRVRLSFEPLSLDDLSKLWAAFQTQYRTSVALRASVVLLESTRGGKAPLPVLRRGEEDRGVVASPDLTPPFPTLTGLTLPNGRFAAHLGDELVLAGHHLDAGTITLRWRHTQVEDPPPAVLVSASPREVRVRLQDADEAPDALTRWAPGVWGLGLEFTAPGGRVTTTNELPVPLAARLVTPLAPGVRDGAGTAPLDVAFSPAVRPAQRAALLLAGREVAAEAHPSTTGTLHFVVPDAPLGEHFVRLRIDGIDSQLVDRGVNPPVFDPAQKVVIS